MKVIYNKHYNYNLGLLKHLHPFEGTKFKIIYDALKSDSAIRFISPEQPVDMSMIDEFLSSIMQYRVRNKNGIFQALEVPKIPLVSFSFLDRKILTPMRWGVAGTLLGAESALNEGDVYWNLSGGYHHAMQQNMEGFCIYNDIGIAYQQLIKQHKLSPNDKILIIDTDAHHGNGNAYTFMENKQITLLDVYNAGIYPTSGYTRDRVDIPVQLPPGTDGQTYLERYSTALHQLTDDYRLAFVVAGTDPLLSDKLGKLCLSIDDIAEREKRTIKALKKRNIPTVILGGGGYSKESAQSVIKAISVCTTL
ncbi:histone deacetylase [Marinibactrum halimedae]|uniref:Histone deacetylase n=1 Tax=Marinibactrum halimedae TaxID=1444977 RepID=A0AA37WLF8_9GAMM|nr:histone deacetylase [Marinibactrum halimedae]MCD9459952.1 histone deacetylase [Marinibactrum halimedae]GLS25190.1 histone deacetylase [Marinibactrum halimedae]